MAGQRVVELVDETNADHGERDNDDDTDSVDVARTNHRSDWSWRIARRESVELARLTTGVTVQSVASADEGRGDFIRSRCGRCRS
jgi:hypothetical protein